MRRLFIALLLMAGCHGGGDGVELHGSAGPPASTGLNPGEYGNDPGGADASASADPDGAVLEPDAVAEASVGPTVVDLPLAGLPAEVARVACRRRLECCGTGVTGLPADEAGCEQALAELLQPYADDVTRSVGDDRVTYDGVALDHCLDQLAAASCAEARVWEPLLIGSLCPIVGATLGEGQPCRFSYECRNGYCSGAGGGHDGRCVTPRLPDGQPCDRGDDCASGTCHATLDVCAAAMAGNLCD